MSQAREIAEQLEVIREYAKLYPSAHGQIIGQETWRIVLSGESLQWITSAADKLVELEQQLGTLLAVLEGWAGDINSLIHESSGVAGLHLNDDLAPWGELEAGGRFERLTHLPIALEAIAAAKAGA